MTTEEKKVAIKKILSEQDDNLNAAKVVIHNDKAHEQVQKAIHEVTRRKLVELFSEKHSSEDAS